MTGLERIAGEQSSRGTDQQFRIYVTLRPDARDVLERSREFNRSHENSVYHAGYPHSHRQASGMPSIQFSIAEDGLSADIDVDCRGSKAPQSLLTAISPLPTRTSDRATTPSGIHDAGPDSPTGGRTCSAA